MFIFNKQIFPILCVCFLYDKYPDSIFMGDYNSKHEFFGCKKYNKEGDILFNILEALNLIVTNDGTPTHYTNTSSDILDLCIVSRSIATKVDTCTVGLDGGGDHMPVHLVINSKIKKKFYTTKKQTG